MPTLYWSILCEYAFISKGENISLINEFDTIYAPSFPYQLPIMFVATKWAGKPSEAFKLGVKIFAPTKKTLWFNEDTITFPDRTDDEIVFSTTSYLFPNPIFDIAGDYEVDILSDEISVHVIPLPVIKI